MSDRIIDGLADALCIRSFDEDPEDPAVLNRTIDLLTAEVDKRLSIIRELGDELFEKDKRIEELEGGPYTHEAVDAFWRVWNEIGRPHIHGVYESTWAAFRAALGVERSAR